MTVPKIHNLDWNDVVKFTAHIAEVVKVKSHIDLVVGISRGGLIPAVLIAHQLGIDQVCSVSARCTVSDDVNSRKLPVPILSFLPQKIDAKLILLVDDVVGSGQTITKVRCELEKLGGDTIHVCALYQNLNNLTPNVPSDLIVGIKDKGWVHFPWERE